MRRGTGRSVRFRTAWAATHGFSCVETGSADGFGGGGGQVFNPADVSDFHDEMAILEKLRHPNIVAFYGACVDNPSHMCIVQVPRRRRRRRWSLLPTASAPRRAVWIVSAAASSSFFDSSCRDPVL